MPKKPMIMKLTVDDFIWLGERRQGKAGGRGNHDPQNREDL